MNFGKGPLKLESAISYDWAKNIKPTRPCVCVCDYWGRANSLSPLNCVWCHQSNKQVSSFRRPSLRPPGKKERSLSTLCPNPNFISCSSCRWTCLFPSVTVSGSPPYPFSCLTWNMKAQWKTSFPSSRSSGYGRLPTEVCFWMSKKHNTAGAA